MLNPNDLDREEFGDRGADNFADDSMIGSAHASAAGAMATDPAADRYGAGSSANGGGAGASAGDANVTNMMDDTSTFGFASVTSSVTRETLAGAADTRAPSQATGDVESNHTPDTTSEDSKGNNGASKAGASKKSSRRSGGGGGASSSMDKKKKDEGAAAAGGPNKRRRRLMIVGAGVLVVAAVLIAVGVTMLSGRDGGGTAAPTMTMMPTLQPTTGAPTPSPTGAPTTVRETILGDMMREVVPNLAPAAFTAGSVQHKAFGWLVDTDLALLVGTLCQKMA